MRNFVCLALFAWLNGCTTIPNVKACSVSGRLANGMDCAFTLEDRTVSMNLDETIDFLEPSQAENRAGAICTSADDFTATATALAQACKLLGSRCKKARIPEAISRIDKLRRKSLTLR